MEKRSLDELLNDAFDDDTTVESSSSSSLAQVVGIILGSPEFQRK
jgi:hypothetical protein